MGWFRRWRRRMRNLSSGGDYAGSHSAGGDGGRGARNANAQGEAIAYRGDRSGGDSAS
jgi:hypothetical protein